MVLPGKASLLVLAVLGCQVSGQLTGSFVCERDPTCPSGLTCVQGMCVTSGTPPAVDARPPDSGSDASMTPAACATTDQLATSFDGTTLPPWAQFLDLRDGATLAVANGEVAITVPAGMGHASFSTQGTRDIRGRAVTVEVPAVAGQLTEVRLSDQLNATATIGVRDGMMFGSMTGSDVAARPYQPVSDRWWRIREAAGSLSWETSPDSVTWAAIATRTAAIATEWLDVGINLDTSATTPAGTARFASLNGGLDASQAFCKLATLRDAFDDGLAGPIWFGVGGPGCVTAERSNTVQFTATGSAGTGCAYLTSRPFDVRDGSVAVEVTAAPVGAETRIKLLSYDDQQQLIMQVENGQIHFIVRASNVTVLDTFVTYDAVAHRFWRLGVLGGEARFEASPDSARWTRLAGIVAPALDASALIVELSMGLSVASTAPVVVTFGAIGPP